MPHIVFEKKELISTPSNKDGVHFDFIAKSYNFTQKTRKTEYRIALKNENKSFLLSLKPKNEHFMIKADKVTRISPVTLVKSALNAYVNLNESNVLFSNTN
jgi:tRNA (guanine-N7-)-methyltransferase